MKVICHRGLWKKTQDQNSLSSFKKAFEMNLGIEIDVRDLNSDIVISHDPPETTKCVYLKDLFEMYNNTNAKNLLIAINIKSDGLSGQIKKLIKEYNIYNYFTFDMSNPEMFRYKNDGLNYFTRLSEHEMDPIMLNDAAGVWLDAFEGEWYDEKYILRLLGSVEEVCVVSAELHGRDYKRQWALLKKVNNHNNIVLCTDKPNEAKEYFV